MLALFSLPEGFFASTTIILSSLTTDLKDLIVLALGIAIGFYVINKLIGLLLGTMKGR